MWELITNIILGISIVTLLVFAVLGLYQWIARKDIKKVDPDLRWMPLPVALMALTYVIFDYVFVVATRPNGSGEPSFPSTHVMIVCTIFFITTIILPHYIKSTALRVVLEILMVVGISLTCTGRILADMHSLWDVLGGMVFAFIFSEIYYRIIKRSRKNAKHLHKNHQ